MANTTNEKLIFTVETVVKGQQQLISLTEQLVRTETQQAAAAQKSAAANAQMAQSLNGVHGQTLMASTGITAMATAYTAASQIFEEVIQVFESVGAAMENVTKTGFDVEKWQRQFTVLQKSPEAAHESLQKFRDFAIKYNLPLDEVVNAAAHLQRVGILTDQSLRAVGDAAVTYSMSMEDVASRMSQVARGNLRGFLDLVPAATSSVLKAQREIEAGMQKSPAALRMLAHEAAVNLEEQVKGGLEKFAAETESQLTGIDERMRQFREQIYEAGWGEAVREVMDAVTNELKRLKADGSLDQWAHAIAGAARVGGDFMAFVIRTAPAVIEMLRFVGPIMGAALLGAAFNALSVNIAASGGIAYMLKVVAFQGGSLAHILPEAAVAVRTFGTAVNSALGPIGWIIIGLTTVASALSILDERSAKPFKIRMEVEGMGWDDLKELAEKVKIQDGIMQAHFMAVAAGLRTVGPLGAAAADMVLARMKTHMTEASDALDLVTKKLDDIRKSSGADSFMGKPQADTDKSPTKSAHELMMEMIKASRETQTAMDKDAQDTTKIVLEQIKLRVDATGAEGAAKLALFDTYAQQVYDELIATGQARADKEVQIEAEVADRRASIIATSTGKARQAMLEELAVYEQKELAANRVAYDSGMTERKIHEGVADDRRKIKAAADAKDAADHATAMLEDARFERDLYGETTEQYIAQLKKRLTALAVTSLDAQKLLKELEQVQRTKADRQEIVKGTTARFQRTGALSDGAAQAAAEVMADEKAAADFSIDLENAKLTNRIALLNEWKGIHDTAFEDMTEVERRHFLDSIAQAKSWTAQMSHGPKVAVDFIKGQFKELAKSEEARYKVAQFLMQANSKMAIAAALEQAAGELKARALVETVDALIDVAKAIERPWMAGIYLAAAAKHGEAAALAGGGAAIASGLARGERASIAEDERKRAAGGVASADAAQGGAGSAASTVGLSVSQGNTPINLNFYNNVSFVGGTTYFGQQGPRDFVQSLAPYIQELFDNHQVRVA